MKAYLWPAARLGDALEALAAESGLPRRSVKLGEPEAAGDLSEWLEAAARHLSLEAQPVETPYSDFEKQVARMGPALIRIGPGFLAVCAGIGRSTVTVLAPDAGKYKIPASTIRAELCSDIEAPVVREIDDLLARAQVAASKQARARDAILRERFSSTLLRGIWLLRLSPAADFRLQLRQARVPRRLLALAGAHLVQYVLWIL